jgi:tape measure domain-containing protein
LGATETELLKVTEAVSQSLLISGTNAQSAAGAILGLSQALGSGRVKAEEFNQMMEGGLQPLLQAVAATDRFGGSVSKLRMAVVDGTVSSQEFYRMLLANVDVLEGKAAKATLTLEGAFTALNNKLIEYVGSAASTSGATGAISDAILGLANNLDTLFEALTVIAAFMATRYVAGMAAATASTIALGAAATGTAAQMGVMGAASFAMQARLAGAATSMEALTFAAGGLRGVLITGAVLAFAGAIYLLATRAQTAEDAMEEFSQTIAKANAAKANAEEMARKLASATGEERRATELAIAATLKKARADQVASLAALKRAQAELTLAQATYARTKASAAATPGRGSAEIGFVLNERKRDVRLKTGEVQGLTESLRAINETVAILKDPLNLPPLPGVGNVGAATTGGKKDKGAKGGGAGPSGPSTAEIAARFNEETRSLMSQYNSSLASMAKSAEERAEFELRNVELTRLDMEARVRDNADYSKAQKAALIDRIQDVADAERQAVEFNARRQLEEEARQLAQEGFNAERDILQSQLDLAVSSGDRKRLAVQLVDLETRQARAVLESVIASQTAAEADKERARIALEAVNRTEDARQRLAVRQHLSPLERLNDELDPDLVSDKAEELIVDEIEHVRNSMRDRITSMLGTKDPLISGLIELLLNQILFRPIAQALENARGMGGGGGGLLGKLFGFGVSILGGGPGALSNGGGGFGAGMFGGFGEGMVFGRASGGPVKGGTLYKVNERRGGPEGFIPAGSGKIIPLSQMNEYQGKTVTLHQTNNIDARGVNPDGFADHIVRKVRGETQQVLGVGLKRVYEGIPARMNAFDRDGV